MTTLKQRLLGDARFIAIQSGATTVITFVGTLLADSTGHTDLTAIEHAAVSAAAAGASVAGGLLVTALKKLKADTPTPPDFKPTNHARVLGMRQDDGTHAIEMDITGDDAYRLADSAKSVHRQINLDRRNETNQADVDSDGAAERHPIPLRHTAEVTRTDAMSGDRIKVHIEGENPYDLSETAIAVASRLSPAAPETAQDEPDSPADPEPF